MKSFLLAAFCYVLVVGCAHRAAPPPVFNVRAFGATGDGATKDTVAFQRSLNACAGTGGEVMIPPGNYLIGSVLIGSHTTIRLSEGATLTGSGEVTDYPTVTIRWEGRYRAGHRALLFAENADNISIVGPLQVAYSTGPARLIPSQKDALPPEGSALPTPTIIGSAPLGNLRNPRGPCLIEFLNCNEVRLEGFATHYQRLWSIHPTNVHNFTAKNLLIRSSLANGDGIDVDSCDHVRIDQCDIDCGDDAIALKSGRGMEAFQMARATHDVNITNCRLGASIFAGLALGTEMSGGIRDIHVSNCTFTRGQNAIYIKSRVGRGGTMENIDIDGITAIDAKAFLRLDLIERGIQDEQPVPGPLGVPRVGNVSITNAVTTCPILVDAEAVNAEEPVQNLTLANITGTSKTGMRFANVRGLTLCNITVKPAGGPLLKTYNVTGSGLDGAESFIPAPPKPKSTQPSRRTSSASVQ